MSHLGKYITLIVLVCFSLSITAKTKPSLPPLTQEQIQQFTYYWYSALQNIDNDHLDEALMQLLFCEQLMPNDAATKNYLGSFYRILGDTPLAIEKLEKACQVNPIDYWDKYIAMQLDYASMKDLPKLIDLMEKVCKQDPKNEEASSQLAQFYIIGKKLNPALQEVNRANKILGINYERTYLQFLIYGMQKRYHTAQQAIEKYLALDPTNIPMLIYRAEILEKRNTQPKKLIEAYKQILKLDPDQMAILNNYAYLLSTMRKGDLKQAESMSQQTIMAEPNNAVFLDTYAWILYLQGEKNLAKYYIKKAMENRTEDMNNKELEQHYKTICK